MFYTQCPCRKGPTLGLSKSGPKDHFWTVPKVVLISRILLYIHINFICDKPVEIVRRDITSRCISDPRFTWGSQVYLFRQRLVRWFTWVLRYATYWLPFLLVSKWEWNYLQDALPIKPAKHSDPPLGRLNMFTESQSDWRRLGSTTVHISKRDVNRTGSQASATQIKLRTI